MVGLRPVGCQLGGGEDGAEEEPGAKLAADQIGVLALPAEAGGLGERLLHDRGGVDEHLDADAGARRQAAGDRLEATFHDIVIVAVSGIGRDGAAILAAEQCQRILGRAVVHAQHDDRAHVRPQSPRVGAPIGRIGQPVHRAMLALGEEGGEAGRRLGDGVRRGDRHHVEAGGGGFPVDQRAEACRRGGSPGPCHQKSRSP